MLILPPIGNREGTELGRMQWGLRVDSHFGGSPFIKSQHRVFQSFT
jgi:hypothetical protein